jgi:putative two-component system response regulator
VAHILIVDDEPEVMGLFREVLEVRGHSVEEAFDVVEARKRLADAGFDLVLCDINLPGETGLTLVRQVAGELPDTAVVIVTAVDQTALAEEALGLGACGYLVKPCRTNDLVISVAAGLRARDLSRNARLHVEELESKVLHRTMALHEAVQLLEASTETAGMTLRETADRLVTALTLRSDETAAHIQRMSRYGAWLALASGMTTWSDDEIRVGMMLHDVGKIGVPDSILLKPAMLRGEEYEIVKRHPLLGAKLLSEGHSPVLTMGSEIALTHHERWDGRGYPSGLARDSIPVVGRIAAIADVFDALTSHRVYREALPVERACEIMVGERARHFDPDLLDVFLLSLDEMLLIRDAHPDPAPTATIRVLLVDSRALFADALVRLLATADDVSVVGLARNAIEAIEMLDQRPVDVVVLDADLPEGNGAAVMAAVRAEVPEPAVIVLAGRGDGRLLQHALEVGGAGIIERDRAFEDLLPAVRTLVAGESVIPAARLVALVTGAAAAASDLTPREVEIFDLMTEGLSNKVIAARLDLRLNTVRNHVQRILNKLGSHSKLEAVATARRRGLLPTP